MKEKWFEVKDLSEFVNSTRKMVFHFFGKLNEGDPDSVLKEIWDMSKEELEELDSTLTYDECLMIAKNHLKTDTKNYKDSYYVSDSMFMTIVEEINSRLVSNILNRLANKGLIETAFDEKIGDFIFWATSDENKTDTDSQNQS